MTAADKPEQNAAPQEAATKVASEIDSQPFLGREGNPPAGTAPDAGNLCIHSMVDTTCLSCMNRLAKDQAATIAALRQATRLCEKHQPKGGTRSACVICSGEQLSYALSRCSYACEEPNEMECSFYDVHMDEDAVVEQVKTLRTERDALRREVEKLKADRDDFHMQECAKCKTEPPYMVADVARRIEK